MLLITILLLFSVFLLLRGHDLPGGGFIGGLTAAAAVALYVLAFGAQAANDMVRVRPRALLGVGLTAAVAAGLIAVLFGTPFLTGHWLIIDLPGSAEVKLSTVLLFDVGVYLVVVGTVLTMLFALEGQ
ncbi:MAG: Na+/H+ antiporter subunit B [Trueperaceae bacterium]|nr:MAG: Na+/H+ antiporter subunit B [Trueperaceae bacterium]